MSPGTKTHCKIMTNTTRQGVISNSVSNANRTSKDWMRFTSGDVLWSAIEAIVHIAAKAYKKLSNIKAVNCNWSKNVHLLNLPSNTTILYCAVCHTQPRTQNTDPHTVTDNHTHSSSLLTDLAFINYTRCKSLDRNKVEVTGSL